MSCKKSLLVCGLILWTLCAALSAMSSTTPAGAYSSPRSGVLCNAAEQVCYDALGPSAGLTLKYLGKSAADALLLRVQNAPRPDKVLNVFRVGTGRYCVQQLAVCLRNGRSDEVLQQALFGTADKPEALRNVLNRKWEWVETLMNNDERFSPENPTRYTVSFMDEGRLALLADCNGGGGAYSYDDGMLSFEGLFTTRMYCGDDSLDHVFLRQLQGAQRLLLRGDELFLLLRYDSGSMRFQSASGE